MDKFKDCKKVSEIIDLIEYKSLEKTSYILLLLWSINPIIEYFLKNILHYGYTAYVEGIIYVIGVIGIFNYSVYFYKNIREHKSKLKDILIRNIPLILIILLFLLAIISTIFAHNKNIAIMGENYRKEGLIKYFLYIGFILSGSIIKNKKYIFNIIKVILFSSIVIVILPMFVMKNVYDSNYTNIYFNSNHYGYYLMICTVLALFMSIKEENNYKKILYLGLFTSLSIFLILNDTFGCILALIIALICLIIYSLIFKWNRIMVLIVSLIFIILSCIVCRNDKSIVFTDFKNLFSDSKVVVEYVSQDPENTADKINKINKINKIGTSRGILWKYAFKFTLDHPIVGGGIESLNHYYAINNIDQDRPHNIVLQISSFIGIPGAITYLILIIYVAYNTFKKLKYKEFSLIVLFFTGMCYFISSMFGNTMFYTSPYFLIVLGLLIGNNKKDLS